jgi:PBP1b-binding outer membrane lipoprotein LpoB
MKKLMTVLGSFLFASMIISCSSNVNIDNFNKIEMGMSKFEVESILGDGDSMVESAYEDYSMEVLTWKDGVKVISISFSNGKVAAKVKVGF